MTTASADPFHAGDDNLVVWRYGQLWKLLYAIERRVLRFSLLDVLRREYDPFEGSVPDSIKSTDAMIRGSSQNMRQIWPLFDPDYVPENEPVSDLPTIEERREGLLRSTHACCWRLGYESEAMWQLYCGPHDGVVIKSTLGQLRSSITDRHVTMRRVVYLDFEKDAPLHEHHTHPALYKRRAYEHEQEVRLLRCLDSDWQAAARDVKFSAPLAFEMQWPTPDLVINEIIVHPRLGDGYYGVVRVAVEHAVPILAAKVQKSRLSRTPVY